MNKERLNAFFDAIFAIIITIMVLEFKTPTSTGWTAILSLIEPIFAYLTSFFILWVSWYSYNLLFKNVEKITYKIYWLIGLNLLLLSFIPFATGWIGQNLFDFTAEIFYAILSFINFIVYHYFTEPVVIKAIPKEKRPLVNSNDNVKYLRNFSILIGILIIYWFPPISIIVMLVLSFLHIKEHLIIDK